MLDPGVADLGQGLEGAFEVDGQLVAQGEQLDADLVGRDPVATVALGAGGVLLASAGAASAPEAPAAAAVAAAVRRKPRRLSRAPSSGPAVSS